MNELRSRLASYFHQDCQDIYGSYEGAIDEFIRDVSHENGEEIERLLREAATMKEKAHEAVRVIEGFTFEYIGMTEQQWLVWLADRLSDAMKNKGR